MRRDGKGKFYRTLNLDRYTREVIKFFNKWKEEAKKDLLKKDDKDLRDEKNK